MPGDKNLFQLFERQIAAFGSRLALEMRPRYRTIRWSYGELGEKVRAFSQILARADISAGDRVLLFSTNSPYWVAAFFAILSRGAIVVPLNPGSPPEQLDRIIKAAEPKLLVKSARLPWTAENLPTIEVESALEETVKATPNLSRGAAAAIGRQSRPEDTVEIVYTSGTTGDPKGVVLTHANLLSNLEALSQAISMKSTDHLLSITPLFHMYAQMTSMFYPLRHGGAVTYLPAVSSRVIRETLERTEVTHLIAVPEFLKTVIDRLEANLREYHLSGLLTSPLLRRLPMAWRRALIAPIRKKVSKTLHTIACGGAPLDPKVESKWRALGFQVLQGYGLTETSPVVSINTYTEHRLSSVGKPLHGVQVKLAPDGELLVKGPNVMKGYYKDEKRTQEAFDDSWFKTDDAGEIDRDGYVYVFGRKKYMILGPGGENVFPEDIEEELNKINGVKDSAVVGLQVDGRTVIHAVLLCESCDGEVAVAQANRRLAPHQQILEWSLWPEADFPRSATRKVRKEEVLRALKARAGEKKPPLVGAVTPLTRLLSELTSRDPQTILPETRLVRDLQLDSLLRIELVSRLEEQFNVVLEERAITRETTVRELEKQVALRRGRPAVLTKYPRWSLNWLCRALRPLLQPLLVFSWLPLVAKTRVSGLKNLKNLAGPVIFMPNHKSYLDSAIMLYTIPRQFRRRLGFAAATDVLFTKFRSVAPLADLVFNSYPFPTEAEENIKPGLEYTGRLIDDGFSIVVFPEGRMNRTEAKLLSLKGGAGLLAVEMQVAVIPVAIIGTEKIAPPGKIWPQRRGRVEIRFGKPLYAKSTDPYPVVTAKIEKALRALLD